MPTSIVDRQSFLRRSFFSGMAFYGTVAFLYPNVEIFIHPFFRIFMLHTLDASIHYVRSHRPKTQFRLHKNAKPEQATLFFVEWEKYLEHIERTGRENQSMDVGMSDHQRLHSDRIQIPEYEDQQQQQRRKLDGALFFGRDVSNDIVFNEDQVGQLDKLREEAAKAAGDGGS
jgi:hypothetical protein